MPEPNPEHFLINTIVQPSFHIFNHKNSWGPVIEYELTHSAQKGDHIVRQRDGRSIPSILSNLQPNKFFMCKPYSKIYQIPIFAYGQICSRQKKLKLKK